MRKLKVFASLIWASLPLFVAAQSNDDLYFVPKKKAETKKLFQSPLKFKL